MAPYTLVPSCNLDDAPELAKTCITAWWEEGWWRATWEVPLDEVVEGGILTVRLLLTKNRNVWRHVKIIDNAVGVIVGYARWELVGLPETTWSEAQSPAVSEAQKSDIEDQWANTPEPYCLDHWEEIKASVKDLESQHEPKVPHIKLDYLCVRPDHQRRGVATKLVDAGIQVANQLGLEIFVRGEGNRAKHLYEKLGFELKASYPQNLNQELGVDEPYNAHLFIKSPARG